MKKLLYIFIAILTVALPVCALSSCAPKLKGVPVTTLDYVDVGYVKNTDWEHAQGLGTDGVSFFFAGHNDATNETADIHVIDTATATDSTVFRRIGALHGAEVCYNALRNTLFVCSGGNKRTPFVCEISKTDGSLLNKWDFEGMGENGGTLIAFDNDKLILFTSSEDGAKIAFATVILGENGAYSIESEQRYSAEDLGVPQGLEFYDGYVYYLSDAGTTVSANPHYIYKISLQNDSVNIAAAYKIKIKDETEGLAFAPDGTVYFGSAEEKIYKITKPLSDW